MIDKKLERDIAIFQERFPNAHLMGVIFADPKGHLYSLPASGVKPSELDAVLTIYGYAGNKPSQTNVISPNDN